MGGNGAVAGSLYGNFSSPLLSFLPLPLHPSPPPVGIVSFKFKKSVNNIMRSLKEVTFPFQQLITMGYCLIKSVHCNSQGEILTLHHFF